MLKIIFILLLYILSFINPINAQLRTPALSPNAKIIQTIGLSDIQIEYSRPSLRGRALFGEEGILPFKKFWRTGANAATKIIFQEDVTIANKPLKKGSYSILTIPDNSQWKINFYNYESSNWNTYVTKEPVITIAVNSLKVTEKLESFTISFDGLSMNSTNLLFTWDTTQVSIPVIINNTDKVLQNIEHTLSGPSDNDYFRSAVYLHEAKLDLNKALEYIQKVTKGDSPRFFQVYREAIILRDLNRNEEAIVAAQKSLKLSQKSNNKDFIRLNQKLIKKLSK
ncbi:DUF2911 domain-containing protein [Aquimarina sp. 2201CG5-10]|uniref:DUF2911 domain-containing protein n=1 Tax=Aquimarina callyspongiae TaxID=3098150 RepID=UPI002AB3B0D2|nr:DUF2911 domain-containing protein [Aquimarina sp. 2201CG5-10]MDY8137019.1 DUF2911 domain-containing protein [Aquimarina sp. 2201CG5-10]